jgi:hypothetical protein
MVAIFMKKEKGDDKDIDNKPKEEVKEYIFS